MVDWIGYEGGFRIREMVTGDGIYLVYLQKHLGVNRGVSISFFLSSFASFGIKVIDQYLLTIPNTLAVYIYPFST